MNKLISSLLKAEAFGHSVNKISLLETHISWVILTGKFAYKIKKPVNFGFLDFSSLEKRREFCYAELQLNKPLATELYLAVVPITGSDTDAKMDGDGEVIEYAVKMREFPQDKQLDRVVATGELTLNHMNQLAIRVANFHQTVKVVKDTDYGNTDSVYAAANQNFSQILEHLHSNKNLSSFPKHLNAGIEILYTWTKRSFSNLKSTIRQRKENGYIRACHGDMHLRNMAILHENIIIFDCIEFNDSLRFIDVMSEVAFIIMDLQYRGLDAHAAVFLNQYLSITGDYSGLKLLDFYLTYRALVRAKVAILQSEQSDDTSALIEEFMAYLDLAREYTQKPKAKCLITHGVSGSGKSTFCNALLQYLPAIHLRSDVERKRLYNMAALSRSHSNLGGGIYKADATAKTYEHLATLTESVLRAGWNTIIDATFLQMSQRHRFLEMAQRLGVEFYILSFSAPKAVLKERVQKRETAGSDASEATVDVLERQLRSEQPLNEKETPYRIMITDNSDISVKMVSEKLTAELQAVPTE